MMECEQKITKTIQKAIDKFVIRADHSWVSKEITHKFIFEALEFFNFGDYFISLIKTMLNNR